MYEEYDWIWGVIGVALFYLGNQQIRYRLAVALSALGVFASAFFIFYDNVLIAQIIWTASTIALFIAYALRFREKQPKHRRDYFKPIAIVLLVIPIIPFPVFPDNTDIRLWWTFQKITYPAIFIFYLYDRMHYPRVRVFIVKYLSLFASGLSIVLLFMTSYAFVQKAEADKQTELARANESYAKHQEADANKMMEIKTKELKQLRDSVKRALEVRKIK